MKLWTVIIEREVAVLADDEQTACRIAHREARRDIETYDFYAVEATRESPMPADWSEEDLVYGPRDIDATWDDALDLVFGPVAPPDPLADHPTLFGAEG